MLKSELIYYAILCSNSATRSVYFWRNKTWRNLCYSRRSHRTHINHKTWNCSVVNDATRLSPFEIIMYKRKVAVNLSRHLSAVGGFPVSCLRQPIKAFSAFKFYLTHIILSGLFWTWLFFWMYKIRATLSSSEPLDYARSLTIIEHWQVHWVIDAHERFINNGALAIIVLSLNALLLFDVCTITTVHGSYKYVREMRHYHLWIITIIVVINLLISFQSIRVWFPQLVYILAQFLIMKERASKTC